MSLLDDGLYQCQVSASDGVPGIRSRVARLTVHVPPDPPVLTPAALNATAGVPVTLVCESSGGRPAPEVRLVRGVEGLVIRCGLNNACHVILTVIGYGNVPSLSLDTTYHAKVTSRFPCTGNSSFTSSSSLVKPSYSFTKSCCYPPTLHPKTHPSHSTYTHARQPADPVDGQQ